MPSCEERIYSNDYYDLLLDYWQYTDEAYIDIQDYCYAKISGILSALFINKKDLPPLSLSEYTYRFIPKLYAPMQEISYPLLKSGILQVQQPPLGLTGQNVIIGIVDSGIDYTSPAFRREDGSSRILAIWDQTIPYGQPERGGNGFEDGVERVTRWNNDNIVMRKTEDVPFGTVYTQDEINAALQNGNPYVKVPTRDETGHGTAMAAAAGGKIGNEIYGGAIDAEFVIVKCKQAKQYLRDFFSVAEGAEVYSETDIMLGCRFVDSYCLIFEKPLVHCLGLGSSMGPHDGTSLFSEYLNELALARSRAVVVCGGNEGNRAGHFSGKGDADVEIRAGENAGGFTLEIWGSIPEIFSVSIVSPGGESTPFYSIFTQDTIRISFIFEQTIIHMNAELTEQSSGKSVMVLRFSQPTAGVWRIRMRNAGVFHMWLPVRNFLSGDVYFLRPDPETTLTEPSYAQEIITISTYIDETGAFWGESGRGYSADGQIKPDFAAPGVEIPVPGRAPIGLPGSNGAENISVLGSTTVTGSSMAAAITAGAIAQFLEWAIVRERDVFIKGREIKSYLQRGASREAGIEYPDSRWGYGRLNLQGAFEALRM